MSWFTDSRFGMFIHWGLYSAAGGRWKDLETPWVSEWLMRKFRIPRTEYRKLAANFNPKDFDADRWMRTAAEAGMKYMVITSKHHDGFAMFDSSWDDYNIVKATPFGRDPLKELAEAGKKHGVRLGFYYSHEQDWYEKGAYGNFWDFSKEERTPEAFDAYLNGKVRHQVKELLTNYGDVAILWFDTPHIITPEQSSSLRKFVRDLAPDCLVNSRLGGTGEWDYESLGDNQPPYKRFTMPTEGIGTMNESWGYKPLDHGYRTPEEVLQIMARLAACNANYMLNVGPDGTGKFPPESLKILKRVGEFLKVNGEALYGSSDLPIAYPDNRWGHVTRKKNCLYFWCFKDPGELRFYGIRNRIRSAEVLGGGEAIPFSQYSNPDYDYHRLILAVPQGIVTPFVIKVTCDGEIDCNVQAYYAGTMEE